MRQLFLLSPTPEDSLVLPNKHVYGLSEETRLPRINLSHTQEKYVSSQLEGKPATVLLSLKPKQDVCHLISHRQHKKI